MRFPNTDNVRRPEIGLAVVCDGTRPGITAFRGLSE